METIFSPLRAYKPVQRLASLLHRKGAVNAHSVPDGLKAPLAALIAGEHQVLLVTYNDLQALRLYEDAVGLLGGEAVAMMPARELALYRVAAESRELSARRIDALTRALTGRARLIVAPVEALLTPLMPVELFRRSLRTLRPGEVVDMQALAQGLVDAGYERVDMVEGKGQFAARGGILDVYPVDAAAACRIEFYGDEIDTLRRLDVMTQRSGERAEEVVIPPASEALLDPEYTGRAAENLERELEFAERRWREEERKEDDGEFDLSLIFGDDEDLPSPFEAEPRKRIQLKTAKGGRLREYAERLAEGRRFDGVESLVPFLYDGAACAVDYMTSPVVLLDEPNHMRERCENIALEFDEHLHAAMGRGDALPGQRALVREYPDLLGRLLGRPAAALCNLNISMGDIAARETIDIAARGVGVFHGQFDQLAAEIGLLKKKKSPVVLLAGGVARGQRLGDTLRKAGVETSFLEEPFRVCGPGEAAILPLTLSHGFHLGDGSLSVIADVEIYGSQARKRIGGRRRTAGQKIQAFTDLAPGNYIVHESHGVGVYLGTVRMEVEGKYRDYLHLQYAGTDKLYVPTDQLDRVQKYIGMEDASPRLNRLGGGEWVRLKQKVKQSIEDMAEELVALYAERHQSHGFAFGSDTPWQREFEENFPYEETQDQLQSIEEIKRDMERTVSMDRLLCGDVGYGKTEVAVRAAFKAVMDSKQVALLVPTTILAQQHYQTLTKRFEGFPVRIDMLSRFKTAAEQKEILKKLTAGDIDILIGTHRMLGSDVNFKDMGLLIVDEEQRFGVAHKERLKKIKKNVDVLTLSATPIPRTLHMSMAGIRDMSLIETPPEERYPVQTYVVDYSDSLVRDAILRELARGGQAYVVYNRVRSIDAFYQHLHELVPEARIVIGHGQMRESALEDVMMDFFEGRYDVLLCSTIIESGLDVPNCNTMIVCDANRFGLSQLYQLRGRVGRSNRLAYCYLTVHPGRTIGEVAEKRLTAIREFTEFGSGFKIAMRDLEIRGAGNILGAEQHGHMSAIGYDLYVKMMDEAVRRLRGERGLGDIETRVDLQVDAYLPEDYVRGDGVRLEVYKRIASIDGKDDRDDVIEELIDRFGDVPRPVHNLVVVSYLKCLCRPLKVDQVLMRNSRLVLKFAEGADVDPIRLMGALSDKPQLMLSATQPPALLTRDQGDAEGLMLSAVPLLEQIGAALSAGQEDGAREEDTQT